MVGGGSGGIFVWRTGGFIVVVVGRTGLLVLVALVALVAVG